MNRGVYEVDGVSLYHIVTGDPNALHDLFNYVSDAIAPLARISAPARASWLHHCRSE